MTRRTDETDEGKSVCVERREIQSGKKTVTRRVLLYAAPDRLRGATRVAAAAAAAERGGKREINEFT